MSVAEQQALLKISSDISRIDDASSSAGPRRRRFVGFAVVLVSIGIGLALMESIVRAFCIGHINTVSRYHDKILKLRPHVGFMNYEENKNWVETNNLGFHDHDRAATNDKYRILFLGDSFVEGRQVSTESLFTIRLEKRFAQAGQKIETINGGVLGTGTAYQYVLWKEFFEPSIRIDHLVLCFYMGNDLVDNNAELMFSAFPGTDHAFFVDSQGEISDVGKRPGQLKKVVTYVRDYSALANTLYEAAYQMKKGREQRSDTSANAVEKAVVGKASENNAGAWEASERGTIALIRKWKSELEGKNIPFDIVVIDRPGRVYNKFELEFMDTLKTTCAQDQIDCIRLKLAEDPYKLYSFDGKRLGHFNERGHETAANELYEYFESRHKAILDRLSN